jgi:tetratricopeptide (TPR) repeat protein
VEHYQKAIQLNPRDANAHNNLGYVYQMMKLPARAAQHYKRATELDPSNTIFKFNYALALAEQGQWQQAATLLEQAPCPRCLQKPMAG